MVGIIFGRKNRCPHSRLEGIYGDGIHLTGGYRLYCRDCGMLLDGPVKLAEMRRGEWD